ncbi:MAG: hypothetical protein Q9167_002260 [Letrouitia subvulpina]
MSDDEYFFDEEEDLYIEDPYAEADDLAEHTMQSPVWINHDPAFDADDIWSDWEYYSDDYYDEQTLKRKRRKIGSRDNGLDSASSTTSKPIMELTDQTPELSLNKIYNKDDLGSVRQRPIVMWKSRAKSPQLPIFDEKDAENIAILKDWRERFKLLSPAKPKGPTQRHENQRAIAVVIRQREVEDQSEPNSQPTATQETTKSQNVTTTDKPLPNGTSSTASSLAKQREKVRNQSKRTALATANTRSGSQGGTVARSGGPEKPKAANRKENDNTSRKAPLQPSTGESEHPNSTTLDEKPTVTKKRKRQPDTASQGDCDPEPLQRLNTNKKPHLQADSSTARKRKAEGPEEDLDLASKRSKLPAASHIEALREEKTVNGTRRSSRKK